MADERTPEQVAADDALTAGIEATNRAYFGATGLVTEYLVIFAEQSFDDEGDAVTAVGTLTRDGDQPIYRTLGLLDYAHTRLRQRISNVD